MEVGELEVGEGERGEDTREWRRTSALCLINQPGSGPAGFPSSTFPPLPLPLSLSLPGTEAQGCGSSPAPRTQAGLAQNPGCKGPHHASTEVRTSRGDGDASWRRRELFKEVPVVSGGQQPFHASAPVDESEVWSGASGALGALSQVVCVAGRPGRQRNL